jgi:phosphoenolpyruvate synthase/pyruvate phosphate dikinase
MYSGKIYPFNATPIPALAEAGSKAFSPIKMSQAGLRVSPGFVCAVSFFGPWLAYLQTTAE